MQYMYLVLIEYLYTCTKPTYKYWFEKQQLFYVANLHSLKCRLMFHFTYSKNYFQWIMLKSSYISIYPLLIPFSSYEKYLFNVGKSLLIDMI